VGAEEMSRPGPAFYALRPGGWRDYVTLLHPPYTAWHLSYVCIGWAAAPQTHADRLVALLVAFFSAVGVSAHALDELNGRPLRTQIPASVLRTMAAIGLSLAVTIGIVGSLRVSLGLLAFVAAGAFIVVAYNMELFGGRFHSDVWFALAWGAFPALTSFWANAQRITLPGVLAVVACYLLSVTQRTLSTPVRALRRATASVSGTIQRIDGSIVSIDAGVLKDAPEGALRALTSKSGPKEPYVPLRNITSREYDG